MKLTVNRIKVQNSNVGIGPYIALLTIKVVTGFPAPHHHHHNVLIYSALIGKAASNQLSVYAAHLRVIF